MWYRMTPLPIRVLPLHRGDRARLESRSDSGRPLTQYAVTDKTLARTRSHRQTRAAIGTSEEIRCASSGRPMGSDRVRPFKLSPTPKISGLYITIGRLERGAPARSPTSRHATLAPDVGRFSVETGLPERSTGSWRRESPTPPSRRFFSELTERQLRRLAVTTSLDGVVTYFRTSVRPPLGIFVPGPYIPANSNLRRTQGRAHRR